MFSQGQFLIDPTAPPEEIARKRAALQKVMRAYGRANNVGEGVGDLMMGIGEGVQNWRVGKAERAQSEGASSAFDSLLGGGPTAAPTMDAGGFPSAPGAAVEPMSVPPGQNADYIRQGLVKRGLPEHVADAFVVNFQDESGLNPGINEVNPIVPGSRGGYGLYQLTGPRRVAYEKFAQERGVGLDDTDAQLDFLMTEMQGPEAAAAKNILSAPDKATAAQAIVRDFLRPAQTHRDSRMARYAGLASQAPAAQAANAMGAQAPTPEPITDPAAYNASVIRQSPDLGEPTLQGMAGRMPAPDVQPMAQGRDALAQALMQQQADAPAQQAIEQQTPPEMDPRAQFNSPQLNAADPTQGILKVLMERGGQSAPAPSAPVAQVQQAMQNNGTNLDVNKAIELMNNPYLDAGKKAVLGAMIERQMQAQDPSRQLDMEYKRAQLDQLRNPQQKPTSGIQEYEYAKSQGFEGSYTDFQMALKKAGATNVNVGDGAPGLGKLSTDYGYKLDPGTSQPVIDPETGLPAAAPIPGSPAWQEQQALSEKAGAAEQNRETSTGIITNAANLARQAFKAPGLPTTGTVGRIAANLPETNAAEVRRQVEVLKSNAKIENLTAMRAASPTGGALGAVSDKENEMLAAKSGALDPDSPTFERDLDDYERSLLRIVHGPRVGDAIFEETRGANKPISEMTDEELEALANGE
jgi:hypothetical protein